MAKLGVYNALCKGSLFLMPLNMFMRPICPTCSDRPVAVNYIKEGVTHYRTQCDNCLRKGKKIKPARPLWLLKGYRKKPACELCGFTAKLPEKQLRVWHIDGNLNNADRVNLRTICLNCQPEIVAKRNLPWKPAPPTADF